MAEITSPKPPVRVLALSGILMCAVFAIFSGLYAVTGSSFLSVCVASGGAIIAAAAATVFARRSAFLPAALGLGAAAVVLFVIFSLRPAEKLAGVEDSFTLRVSGGSYTEYGSGVVEGQLLTRGGQSCPAVRIKLILKDGSPAPMAAGDKITVRGRCSLTSSLPRLAQGSFINIVQTGDMTLSERGADSMLSAIRRFSASLSRRITALIGGDEGGLLSALLCGDRRGFSEGFSASLGRSGLAHIAAVSGLHVSIITSILCLLLGKRAGIVGSVLLLPLFAAMTGFSPSVLRAVIMGSLSSGAFLLRREYDPLTSIFTAAAVLCAFNPFSLFSPSFLLSFCSTLGIILIGTPLTRLLQKKLPANLRLKSLLAGLGSAAAVSVAAIIFTLPLQLICFPSVSLVALVSNLLAVWAVPIAMFCGIILVVLCAIFPAAGGIAVPLLTLPLRYLVFIINLMGDTLSLSARSDNIYLAAASVGLVIFCLLYYFERLKGTSCALLCTLCVCLCIGFSVIFPAERLYLYGEEGISSVVFTSGRKTYAVNAPVSYGGSYFTQTASGGAQIHTLIVTDSRYAASGNVFEAQAGRVYLPIPGDEDALVYSQSGELKLGKATAELIHTGSAAAVRLRTPKCTLLDVTGISPYDSLPPLGGCHVLVINPAFASAPAILGALCAQTRPSVVFISGRAEDMEYLKDICACTVLSLDELGSVRIY